MALRELAALDPPPPTIYGVVEATLAVLGHDSNALASWAACQKLMAEPGPLLERMRMLDTAAPVAPLHPRLLAVLGAGVFEKAESLNEAVVPLVRWLRVLNNRADGYSAFIDAGVETVPDIFALPPQVLRSVRDLVVRRRGVAEIIFHGELDLACADSRGLAELPLVLRLAPGEVSVYPEPLKRPPVGEGFNRSATVTLYGCFPPSYLGNLLDPARKEIYREEIATRTEAKGARFIDYDADRGIWQFSVNHF